MGTPKKMMYTEKNFGLCLNDKLSKNESLSDIADFAREFKKNCTFGNDAMISILETLSGMNGEDDDVNINIPREKLKNLTEYLQEGSVLLPSRKLVHPRFHIDTNRINAKCKLDSMNQLEQWKKDGVIDIESSEIVLGELKKYKNGSKKAAKGLFTSVFEEEKANPSFCKIESILFPNGCKNDNQKNDVFIVFHALKYHCILITNDGDSKTQPGGMLGHAACLKKELGVEIMRDSEAVEEVRNAIRKRDEYAKSYSAATGMPLLF